MYRKGVAWLAAGMFLAGIGVLLYPEVSNQINNRYGSYAIQQMCKAVDNLEAEQMQSRLAEAREYNQKLKDSALSEQTDADWYESILDFGNGIMGYITIPKINVKLPVYHGVEPEVLEKGVGHMQESAFPIGGEGNHTVLTGHTGLPSARLFTDLTELAEGDRFQVVVGDIGTIYQIDQIRTVLPNEVGNLKAVPGADYCTLVTCTPYGVNSHRLLVRGKRIEQDAALEAGEEGLTVPEEKTDRQELLGLILIPALVIAGIAVRKRRKRDD